MGICNCYKDGRCYGTKEMEECHCMGNLSVCDFYPEKRNYSNFYKKRLEVIKDIINKYFTLHLEIPSELIEEYNYTVGQLNREKM